METNDLKKVVNNKFDTIYIYKNNKLLFTSFCNHENIEACEKGEFVFGYQPINSIRTEEIDEAKIVSGDLIIKIFCD